ncbi:hypothetical protein [Bradyrhizobium ivorense]|uniref:hypothetical protein n=1 Tax=Bradyrhizobium ivorense TaxID=2511166 RepID=UPI0011176031|nr:hypothetical protein [Bradyrhizobium ivorense]
MKLKSTSVGKSFAATFKNAQKRIANGARAERPVQQDFNRKNLLYCLSGTRCPKDANYIVYDIKSLVIIAYGVPVGYFVSRKCIDLAPNEKDLGLAPCPLLPSFRLSEDEKRAIEKHGDRRSPRASNITQDGLAPWSGRRCTNEKSTFLVRPSRWGKPGSSKVLIFLVGTAALEPATRPL